MKALMTYSPVLLCAARVALIYEVKNPGSPSRRVNEPEAQRTRFSAMKESRKYQ